MLSTNQQLDAPSNIDSLAYGVSGTKVIITKGKKKGKFCQHCYVIKNQEPQFLLEYDAREDCDFVIQSKDNKLIGVLKDGELFKPESLEKIFYLSKLDLTPSEELNINCNGYTTKHEENGVGSLNVTARRKRFHRLSFLPGHRTHHHTYPNLHKDVISPSQLD